MELPSIDISYLCSMGLQGEKREFLPCVGFREDSELFYFTKALFILIKNREKQSVDLKLRVVSPNECMGLRPAPCNGKGYLSASKNNNTILKKEINSTVPPGQVYIFILQPKERFTASSQDFLRQTFFINVNGKIFFKKKLRPLSCIQLKRICGSGSPEASNPYIPLQVDGVAETVLGKRDRGRSTGSKSTKRQRIR